MEHYTALLQGGAGHGPRGGGQVRGAPDPGGGVREQVSHAGPRGPLRTEEYCYDVKLLFII